MTIEAITTAALSASLGVSAQRHALVASNIANANVEGYVPRRLSFDAHLEDVRSSLRENGRLGNEDVTAIRNAVLVESAPDAGPAAVQIDVEMAELSRNAVHFQAVSQGLSRHLSMLALAVSEGRR